MPAGSTFTPRAIPTRLAGLGRLPKRKVTGRSFACRCASTFALLVFDGTIAEPTVFGILHHIEKDIAVDFVSESSLDEFLSKANDLAHAVGGSWKEVDLIDPESLQVRQIVGGHLCRHLEHRDARFFEAAISLSSTSVMLTTQVTS